MKNRPHFCNHSLSLRQVRGGVGGMLSVAAVRSSLWAPSPICMTEIGAVTGGGGLPQQALKGTVTYLLIWL